MSSWGQFALLQSRQAFRYQPDVLVDILMVLEHSWIRQKVLTMENGEYIMTLMICIQKRRCNFYIVRRSNIAYDVPMLQELGVADSDGNIDLVLLEHIQKLYLVNNTHTRSKIR
ncbi:MAG: hypothetical protein CM15mV5_0390 [uncultured marine virus]|nr:MAG: hypothetical protein CM15mV5_0390 [uncultured marine virus]